MNKHSLEWFWEGCEAQGALNILVKLPGQPHLRERVLQQPFAVVGRDPRAHLRLEDMGVSLRHAYFQVVAGHLFVMDLASATGIHATTGPLRSGWVPFGDPIGIGPYWLRFLKNAGPEPGSGGPAFDPLAAYPADKSLMPLSLEFLNGRSNRARWPVDRAMTLIGSAAACKVRLRSSRVSAFHCSVIWTPRGAWVVDLLGEGGVRVNGVPVPLASLEHDDRLQVGEFVIRVCHGPAADVPRVGARRRSAVLPAGNEPGEANHDEVVNGRQGVYSLPPTPAMPSFADPAAAILQNGALARLPALAPPQEITDPTHAALVPLLSQFGAMQEQMADQFRQTLMMMFQMFSALHKDQMAFFQQEMDRVQQLTQELHQLQMEAARNAPASAPMSSSALPALAAPAPSRPVPRPIPTGPIAAPPAASDPPPPHPKVPPTGDGTPATPAGQDIHVWLCKRMAAVQEERQSRWQKLVGLLGGKPADAPG